MRQSARDVMSQHATRRCQQRGVPHEVVQLLLDHHDLDREAGSGCRILRISRRRVRSDAAMLEPQLARRLENLAVIWSDDRGQIVTVLRNHGTSRRYAARA